MTHPSGTTDTDGHPEVAEISALTEGALPPERSADVRGHLGHCVLCADVRASLDEIRGLLGTLPGPPQMPADIAGRIDAALAAEALLDAAPAPSAVSRETATTPVSRETSPAADRPSGHPSAAGGPGRPRGRRRRWTRVTRGLLVTASVAAVLGLGGLLSHSLTAGSGSSSDSGAADSSAAKSDPALESLVHQLLATAGATQHIQGEGQGVQNGGPSMKAMESLPSCVAKGIGRTGTPLAFDHGTYEGTDSYLVLLPNPENETRVDAYVVDASCVTAGTSQPGTVLSKDTYAR